MKIAIISDLHLGDTNSVMAYRDKKTNEICMGSRFQEFIRKVEEKTEGQQLDYLVLLGDVLDFSITSYWNAYEIGRFFFQKLKDADIAKEIIYVPGNHDYDMWNTVQYEINITNRLKSKKLPIPFRNSIPGIIDDREGQPTQGFTLHNVSANTQKTKPKYAGLFLDNITQPATQFNFAYPNIYLITGNQTILITHSQYLGMYWSILGKWGVKILNDDLHLEDPKQMNLKELVAVNSPLSVLGCSAIGQAGPLTNVVQALEHEIKERDLKRVDKYLTRIGDVIKQFTSGLGGCVKRLGYKIIKKEILKALENAKSNRYNVDFYTDPNVRQRFIDYYGSTLREITQIQDQYKIKVPVPDSMICGHTHQPIPWGSASAPKIQLPHLPQGDTFVMYNTGGWLNHPGPDGQLHFCGAEIFFYETGKGISSVGLRQPR